MKFFKGTDLSWRRGVTTTEFVLVVPSFLLVLFLMIEIGLFVGERHILSQALYSAARYAVVEVSRPKSDNLIHKVADIRTVDVPSPCSQELMKQLKWKIAGKLALVTPSLETLFAGIGKALDADLDIFRSARSKISENVSSVANETLIGKSLLTLLKGVWSAYLLSSIESCLIDKNGVSINVTYQYHPKTPIAGRLVWALFWLNSLSAKSGFSFDVGPDFTGVKIKSAAQSENLQAGIATIMPGLLAELGNSISARRVLDRPLNSGLIDVTDGKVYESIAENLHALEFALTQLILSFPEELRFIPIKSSMTVSWLEDATLRYSEKLTPCFRGAVTTLVGPMTPPLEANCDADSDSNYGIWSQWSKELARKSKFLKD